MAISDADFAWQLRCRFGV